MSVTRYRFGNYVLDTGDRSLRRDDAMVALNARYFDALTLLVREHGQLIGKQRFFDEVWAGSVVTDAALTQCIKEIRRQLGDDASQPRFIRTVAGHGYCFVADLDEPGDHAGQRSASASAEEAAAAERSNAHPTAADAGQPQASARQQTAASHWLVDVIAASAGGAVAGLLGGLLYGSLLTVSPAAQGVGSLSVLLVLLSLSVSVGMAGALGVGLGLAAGRRIGKPSGIGMLAGSTLGGLLIGGLAKLLGSDTFTVLVGHAPAGITGGLEGAVIGFALAAGLLLGGGLEASRGARPVWSAALSTAVAGMLINLAGGNLMAGSLARVAESFNRSRLDLAPLAQLFGADHFGLWAKATLGALEGGIFGACVVAALLLAHRQPR